MIPKTCSHESFIEKKKKQIFRGQLLDYNMEFKILSCITANIFKMTMREAKFKCLTIVYSVKYNKMIIVNNLLWLI